MNVSLDCLNLLTVVARPLVWGSRGQFPRAPQPPGTPLPVQMPAQADAMAIQVEKFSQHRVKEAEQYKSIFVQKEKLRWRKQKPGTKKKQHTQGSITPGPFKQKWKGTLPKVPPLSTYRTKETRGIMKSSNMNAKRRTSFSKNILSSSCNTKRNYGLRKRETGFSNHRCGSDSGWRCRSGRIVQRSPSKSKRRRWTKWQSDGRICFDSH